MPRWSKARGWTTCTADGKSIMCSNSDRDGLGKTVLYYREMQDGRVRCFGHEACYLSRSPEPALHIHLKRAPGRWNAASSRTLYTSAARSWPTYHLRAPFKAPQRNSRDMLAVTAIVPLCFGIQPMHAIPSCICLHRESGTLVTAKPNARCARQG